MNGHIVLAAHSSAFSMTKLAIPAPISAGLLLSYKCTSRPKRCLVPFTHRMSGKSSGEKAQTSLPNSGVCTGHSHSTYRSSRKAERPSVIREGSSMTATSASRTIVELQREWRAIHDRDKQGGHSAEDV
jgi:hypothetical protein